MNTPRVPVSTGTLGGPYGCQRRLWEGGDVNVEAVVGVRRRRWWCSGAPTGPLAMLWFHLTVPSSHLRPLCCVVTLESKRTDRMESKRGEDDRRWERGSNSGRFLDGQRTRPHYSPAPVRISWQNEVLSGPPPNVIIELCLLCFELFGASLHFGVPKWLHEITRMIWCRRMLEPWRQRLGIV